MKKLLAAIGFMSQAFQPAAAQTEYTPVAANPVSISKQEIQVCLDGMTKIEGPYESQYMLDQIHNSIGAVSCFAIIDDAPEMSVTVTVNIAKNKSLSDDPYPIEDSYTLNWPLCNTGAMSWPANAILFLELGDIYIADTNEVTGAASVFGAGVFSAQEFLPEAIDFLFFWDDGRRGEMEMLESERDREEWQIINQNYRNLSESTIQGSTVLEMIDKILPQIPAASLMACHVS